MEITAILEVLKNYDAVTIIVGLLIYLGIHKKINIVDKAVNQRPIGSKTISQEVTEINHKLDLFHNDVSHIRKEIDEHRAVDEVAFNDIRKDIRLLASKL